MKYIIKRDGRKESFDSNKIYSAVYKAAKSVNCDETYCHNISDSVRARTVRELNKYENDKYPTVEEVQDIVIRMLINSRESKISEAYIKYRNERTKQREAKSKLMDAINEITFASSTDSNLKRDNGNVNGDTPMGMMLQYGSTVAKQFADDYLISKDIEKHVKNGEIYIHDKDFLPSGTLTCCQIPLDELFKNGFNTGHGYVRPPQSIRSYASLAAIAIQSNQNDQHGGQAIPLFDFYLAPGVAKTFVKELEDKLSLFIFALVQKNMIEEINGIINEFDLEDFKIKNHVKTKLKLKEKLTNFLTPQDANKIVDESFDFALQATEKETYQAMESFIHNLNTMHSRAGAQVPFSSINFGMDTSEEGRMVSRNLLLAQEAGLGNGETPIFPILIFQVKEGVNYNQEDKNYDLFKLAMRVSAKRLFPNFVFVDAPFNLQYYDPKDPETIIATMGCVDGEEVITYKIENDLYVESFERAWNRLTNNFKVNTQGLSKYLELNNVTIYDSSSKGFVKCKKMIKNPDMNNWRKVTFETGKVLLATSNHPLPVIFEGENKRVFIDDILIESYGLTINDNKVTQDRIIQIEKLGYRNKPSYDVETESDYFDVSGILSHNCRTRVIGNVNGKQTPVGRGNLSFTTINLPRLGIKHGYLWREQEEKIEGYDRESFYHELDTLIDTCIEQLLERYEMQKKRYVNNFPFLMGQGVWRGSENLQKGDELGSVIDTGTLSVGFIGLAECLVGLTGKHHGEDERLQILGLEIVGHMRDRMDEAMNKYHLNFSLLGTPAEGLSGFFTRIDKSKYGVIEGITDKDYYTNSFHIPVYYKTSFIDKIKKEAPYHALTNAGHITYVEMDGDPANNLEAFETVIRCMKENGIGYGSINHPVDRDPVCGYSGVIDGNICPKCGRDVSADKIITERIKRVAKEER